MNKFFSVIAIMLSPVLAFPQSDLDRAIKGGEIILSGLSILKVARSTPKADSKIVEVLCIKNKLSSGITFRMVGKDADGNEIKKELVVPKDGKECLFKVPKGIYTYEIVLANKEVYRKGEYNFDDELTMTVKED